MKNSNLLFIAIFAAFIIGCSGSDTYRGAWKAMNADGAKFEINFEAKSFTVKDSTGKNDKYGYTQNSVHIENSSKTYGIILGTGQKCTINFPNAADETSGLIKDDNDNTLYTINRKKYMTFEDVQGFR